MERKLKVSTVFSEVSSAGFRTLSNNTSGNFCTALLGTFELRFRALSSDTQTVLNKKKTLFVLFRKVLWTLFRL